MTGAGAKSYRWLETLLDVLIARFERSEAMTLMQDLGVRERTMRDIAPELESAGMPAGMLATPEGQNLFVAVLTLRIRFSEQEAREKVALNIAMRDGRSRSP